MKGLKNLDSMFFNKFLYLKKKKKRWKQIDPEKSKNGPSQWLIKKNFKNRDEVIYQESSIYSIPKIIPAILELKIEKVFNI